MKALAYEQAHPLDAFAIDLVEVEEPRLREGDVLIEVRAIGVNPGEAFIRSARSAEPGGRVILGWEFAGVVIEIGAAATGFTVGDHNGWPSTTRWSTRSPTSCPSPTRHHYPSGP
jgi:NADPH:quinone reductase-like Zn-dependent oxidoreductase